MKIKRKPRLAIKIELANRRKSKRLKLGKPFPARRKPTSLADWGEVENTQTGQTFDYLYKIFKNTGRGLQPNPAKRGNENPYVTGKMKSKGFPLIVCALSYPQSLVDSFKNLKGISINHYVRRYA